MAPHQFRVPNLCLHKSSGQAYAKWKGKRTYFGKWNSPEAIEKYETFIAELRRLHDGTGELNTTIRLLSIEFMRHAADYYLHPDGSPTSELACYRAVLKALVHLFGEHLTCEFDPAKLICLQEEFARNHARTTINRNISRIRYVFGWGVIKNLVPTSVPDKLKFVPPLKLGRTKAREPEPVASVPLEVINRTLPGLSPSIRGMVQLQLKTAARPSEIRLLKVGDLDTSGEVWIYCPGRHKNSFRGKSRIITVGPKGQQILTSAMIGKEPGDYVFAPDNATPTKPYTLAAYRRAITRVCDRLALPRWTPNQLRHTAATEICKSFDQDASRTVLGHTDKSTTEIYLDRDVSRAAEIMLAIG
ncbi:site-specific tyrosine recombinase XerC [Thalassoglobus neptunius]|uniref:Site-specific tyrosine recombinase XerC n=1 Tax=Thalassoglobus neptunius TaxID=1938619 RepID=A0A5C5X0I5_9PLAN|nr:tyrosine-type recombinase/integrase [Thalassoglobus neptunius]TWT56654.1 site-specific tyrosine recombinase XerC [Thalassoglobus neptunius]